ncbi:hypothetical protein D8674_009108 [Pyrus ussuriensis x Pyrus communis]|uniref:Uncharacterized protein n=1 Tax=Pyrus ussuriensis x Pyrus communis TaxID=2448454 RepID=A0A5N5HVB0_9ROSA|nr:hypothetical protein D8674_009108 [Pyrus ussuriensis x Pyrus communis]
MSSDALLKIYVPHVLHLLLELEGLSDPMRKDVSQVRKKINAINKELKSLGHTCQKKEKEYRHALEAFNEKNREKVQLITKLMESGQFGVRVSTVEPGVTLPNLQNLGSFQKRLGGLHRGWVGDSSEGLQGWGLHLYSRLLKLSALQEKEYRDALEAFNEKNREKVQLITKLMELVSESEKTRVKKLEELSKNIESLK